MRIFIILCFILTLSLLGSLPTQAAPILVLELNKVGTGKASITSTPVGLNCTSTCVLDYLYLPVRPSTVTVAVTPEAGSQVAKWSLPSCLNNTSCIVPLAPTLPITKITVTINKIPGYVPLTTPTLTAVPTRFSFVAQQNGPSPSRQQLVVTTALKWSVSAVPAWLRLSFVNANTLSVLVVQTVMTPGTYTATLRLNAVGAVSINIPVTVLIQQAPIPSTGLMTDKQNISIIGRQWVRGAGTNPPPVKVIVTGATNFIVTMNQPTPWIRIDKFPGYFHVQALVDTLVPGFQTAPFTVTTTEAVTPNAQPMSVTLQVLQAPTLVVSPASLTFDAALDGGNPRLQHLYTGNAGFGSLGTLTMNTGAMPSWLTISATGREFSVTAQTATLTAGTYTHAVVLGASQTINGPITIPITVNVVATLPLSAFGTISWDPNLNDTKGYRVYRSTTRGVYTGPFIAEIPHSVVTFEMLKDLVPGTDYFFRVTAFNEVGESPPSNEIGIRITAAGTLIDIPPSLLTTWADWNSSTLTPARVNGTLNGSVVIFTSTGPILAPQLGSATEVNFFQNFPETYTSPTVLNSPPNADAVRIIGPGTHTITFTSPVTNPVMAVLSLGGFNTVSLNFGTQPVILLKTGPGHWGIGAPLTVTGNVVAAKEGNGLLQFPGTMTTLTFTSDLAETWWGFTIGTQ